MIAKRLSERARDVGLMLYECNRHGASLGRLQLQKIIYLLDCTVLIQLLYTPDEGHEVYFNGPYDQRIQDAVDIMAFRGLVDAVDITVRANGHVTSRYTITQAGRNWVDQWRGSIDTLANRASLAEALVDGLVRRSALGRLKELVYVEPTYTALRGKGNGFQISLTSFQTNISAQVLALMDRSLRHEGASLTSRFLAEFFLEFLEARGTLGAREGDDENDASAFPD